MKQKVIKYTILLLLIPVIISIVLSFMQVNEEKKYPNDNYDGMDIPTYSDTKVDEIKYKKIKRNVLFRLIFC